MALEDEGFEVRLAENALFALTAIQQRMPDLMILDLMMPEVPGDELCRMLRQDPAYGDLPIFILSARSDVETKVHCLNCGANEYLTKPIDIRELTARIHSYLRAMAQAKLAVSPKSKSKTGPPSTLDIFLATKDDSYSRIKSKYGVYRIQSLVGSGAMGHVFRATDEVLDRDVAVKVLSRKLSGSEKFAERFRREAKMLAAVDHIGVAAVYSFGEEESDLYFAMQWCSGGSLEELLTGGKRMDLLHAISILLQCAHGLSAASRKGIVHRDIKPSNIMFDENQTVKIVDFGLASIPKSSGQLTSVAEVFGTPNYMAPEQARSANVDFRSDMYSLGITFYQMLYGSLPFTGSSMIEVLIKQSSHPLPRYEELPPEIPHQAYAIIETMVRKDPDDRYKDYASLIQDLEKLRREILGANKVKIPKIPALSQTPFFKGSQLLYLLTEIYRTGESGVLTLGSANIHKNFLIREREIVFFESSLAEENIWNALAGKKIIEQKEIPKERDDWDATLNSLLRENKINLERFRKIFCDLLEASLVQAYFWPTITGEFRKVATEKSNLGSVPITNVILDITRSLVDFKALDAQFPDDHFVIRTPSYNEVVSVLKLNSEERFLESRFEEDKARVQTLQMLTGFSREVVVRFLFVLEKLGAIEHQKGEKPATRKEPATPVQIPVTASSPPKRQAAPPPKNLEMIRMELQKTDKEVQKEHHIHLAEQFYRLAEMKFTEKDYWKVTELCKQAIKNNANNPRYFHLAARAYEHHPRFLKDAEQWYQKAAEMDPWNPDYQLDMGKFFLKVGAANRALHYCKKALEIMPNHPAAKAFFNQLEKTQGKQRRESF